MCKVVAHCCFTKCSNHRWSTKKDNGYLIYEECSNHKCRSRQVSQRTGGNQLIDNAWVLFRKDIIEAQ